MIGVAEATALVMANRYTPTIAVLPIENCVNRVLAEQIMADRDFPPFHRVAMDGIAISHAQWLVGSRSFTITGVQAAGESVKVLSSATDCMEVMTGAVLPIGTDTVIRYEDLQIVNGVARLQLDALTQGQCIHHQQQDAAVGDVLLEPGIRLSPAEIALLASVGKHQVHVKSFPRTAIVSSGDELVAIEKSPEPHQIRRSNTYALQASMKEMGWPAEQHHLPDNQEAMTQALKNIVASNDVIVLSGGVSKGKFDYVPQVLETLGIKKLFHRVSQKPGKPFWFGVSPSGQVVFALPGNPVSTYMCFYRYINPWLVASVGLSTEKQEVILSTAYQSLHDLTYFLQVKVINDGGKLMAQPSTGGGSGDFVNLKSVTGFVEIPAGQGILPSGSVLPYYSFRN